MSIILRNETKALLFLSVQRSHYLIELKLVQGVVEADPACALAGGNVQVAQIFSP